MVIKHLAVIVKIIADYDYDYITDQNHNIPEISNFGDIIIYYIPEI